MFEMIVLDYVITQSCHREWIVLPFHFTVACGKKSYSSALVKHEHIQFLRFSLFEYSVCDGNEENANPVAFRLLWEYDFLCVCGLEQILINYVCILLKSTFCLAMFIQSKVTVEPGSIAIRPQAYWDIHSGPYCTEYSSASSLQNDLVLEFEKYLLELLQVAKRKA